MKTPHQQRQKFSWPFPQLPGGWNSPSAGFASRHLRRSSVSLIIATIFTYHYVKNTHFKYTCLVTVKNRKKVLLSFGI